MHGAGAHNFSIRAQFTMPKPTCDTLLLHDFGVEIRHFLGNVDARVIPLETDSLY
jgi:hypothetical protein